MASWAYPHCSVGWDHAQQAVSPPCLTLPSYSAWQSTCFFPPLGWGWGQFPGSFLPPQSIPSHKQNRNFFPPLSHCSPKRFPQNCSWGNRDHQGWHGPAVRENVAQEPLSSPFNITLVNSMVLGNLDPTYILSGLQATGTHLLPPPGLLLAFS